MFIGRQDELNFFNNKYNENGGQLIVLYGRRRVGKTETLREFCKESLTSFFPVLKQQMLCSLDIFRTVCYEKRFRQKTISLPFMIGKRHSAPFWNFPMKKRKNY